MDPQTLLTSRHRVECVQRLLEITNPSASEWHEMFAILHQRLRERFFQPIRELRHLDKRVTMRPGFSILALDCLLIETLISFRAGGVMKPGESGRAFKAFLRERPAFKEHFRDNNTAKDFYDHVRNGLLHDGETRQNWRVRTNRRSLFEYEAESRIIDRNLFHKAILTEYRQYFSDLRAGRDRKAFRMRMKVLCQSGDPSGGH